MSFDNFLVISGAYGQPEPWEVPAPRKLSRDGSKSWIPPGQEISIAGRSLDGMVYVGSDLGPIAKWNPSFEPALILPNATVAAANPDITGERVRFNQPYAKMHPESRAAYLDWLAAGRPHGASGRYVLLFLYGLERRILHDAVTDETARAEIPRLLQEIARLVDIYPELTLSYDFLPRLQIALQVGNGEPIDPDMVARLIEWQEWEMPPLLRLVLGQFVAQRKPIPPEWALNWYFFHPDTGQRAVVQRCPEEFARLFELLYRDHLGEGLTVKMPRYLLDGYYHYPSSPSFGSHVFIPATNIPDISRVKKPVEQINEIAKLAIARLTPYSRAIGSGWKPHSAAAIALLPPEISNASQVQAVVRLKRMLDESLGTRTMGDLPLERLLEHFPEFNQPPTASQLRSLGNLLQQIGFGVEPNPATARAEFTGSPDVTLFRIDPTEAAREHDLAGIIALLDLGRHVASERGAVPNDVLNPLIASLTLQFGLSPNDVARLHAYLAWAGNRPVSLSRLRSPLRSVDPNQLEAAAPLFFAIGETSSPLGSAEITLYGKVYAALGLDQQRLHSDLHARSTSRSSNDRGRPSAAHVRTGALDREQVRAVREETDEVAHVLHGVFGSNDEPRTVSAAAAPIADIYAALVPLLATRPAWPMADLRVLTELVALPLAGTIETLNDRAAARGLEPLLDCDDEICDVSATSLAGLLAQS